MNEIVPFPQAEPQKIDDIATLVEFSEQQPAICLLRMSKNARGKAANFGYAVFSTHSSDERLMGARGDSLKDTLFVMNRCRTSVLSQWAPGLLPRGDVRKAPGPTLLAVEDMGDEELEIVAIMDPITGMIQQINVHPGHERDLLVQALLNATSEPSMLSPPRVMEDIKTGLIRISSTVQRSLDGTLFWEKDDSVVQVSPDHIEMLLTMLNDNAFGPLGDTAVLRLVRAVGTEITSEVHSLHEETAIPSREEIPEHLHAAYDWGMSAMSGDEIELTVYLGMPDGSMQRMEVFGEENEEEFPDFWADLVADVAEDDEAYYVVQKIETTPLMNLETRKQVRKIANAVLDSDGLKPVDKNELRNLVRGMMSSRSEEEQSAIQDLVFSDF